MGLVYDFVFGSVMWEQKQVTFRQFWMSLAFLILLARITKHLLYHMGIGYLFHLQLISQNFRKGILYFTLDHWEDSL